MTFLISQRYGDEWVEEEKDEERPENSEWREAADLAVADAVENQEADLKRSEVTLISSFFL